MNYHELLLGGNLQAADGMVDRSEFQDDHQHRK
jgi:hypothetical protein